jgi:glutaredoxin-like YruB-family protein
MSKSNVIVYSADWCGFCRSTKAYLTSLNVPFEEKNVEKNPADGQEAVDKSHQRGIPVIDICGDIIVGFDRPKIDASLRQHQLIS